MDLLDDSFFGRALKPAMNQYLKQNSLLILETRIDLAYLERFVKLIKSLHGDDRQQAERFLGFFVDSQIVLWAYRFRIYYHLSPEEILNFSLQNEIRITPEILQEIASGAEIPVVLKKVWGRELPGIKSLVGLPEKEALSEMEHLFSTYLHDQALDVQKGYAMNFGILLGFDTLLKDEVRDLITVAEGKFNNLPLSQIKPFLIGDRVG